MVDLLSDFIKTNGHVDQIDLGKRVSADFDPEADILNDRAKVPMRTDFREWNCKEAGKHTSYIYNTTWRLVGDYENRASAQPVKDWCLTTYKLSVDSLETPTQQGLVTVWWGDLPILLRPVYQWPHLGFEKSEHKALEIPSLPQEGGAIHRLHLETRNAVQRSERGLFCNVSLEL